MLEAAGLRNLQARDQWQLQSCALMFRYTVEPIDDISHKPIRRLTRLTDDQIPHLIFASRRELLNVASANAYRYRLHYHHTGTGCTRIRRHLILPTHPLCVRGLLHVQENPATRIEGSRQIQQTLRRALRRCHQHHGSEDLRARRSRTQALRTGRPRNRRCGIREHARNVETRCTHIKHYRHHHERRCYIHSRRKRVVWHQRWNACHDVHLHIQPDNALQYD